MIQTNFSLFKVEVYKNLHNGKWSLRDANTKHVLGHADKVLLYGVTPKIGGAGRNRVLRTGHKNVHAYLVGVVRGLSGFVSYKDREISHPGEAPSGYVGGAITYNPYSGPTFTFKGSGEEYTGSQWVFMDTAGVTACKHLSVVQKPHQSARDWDGITFLKGDK